MDVEGVVLEFWIAALALGSFGLVLGRARRDHASGCREVERADCGPKVHCGLRPEGGAVGKEEEEDVRCGR